MQPSPPLVTPAAGPPSATAVPASPDRRPGNGPRLLFIDAVRGLAALNILLFHSVGAHSAGTLSGFLDAVLVAVRANPLRVNVFFVISGWCLAGIAFRAAGRGASPWSFFRDRALRIFPLYWIVLAIAIALRLLATPFNHTTVAANLPADSVAVAGDLFLIQPSLGTVAALLVSWTLVYEIGFYALVTLGLFAARRGLSHRVILLAATLLAVLSLSPGLPRAFLVLHLWPDFMVGVLAWFLVNAPALRHVSLPCALVVAATVLARDFQQQWLPHLSVLGTGFTLALLSRHDARLRDFRVARGLAWVGGFSYSLYLIHVPVLSPFLNLAARFAPVDSPAFIGAWLAGLALAIVSGWLLYRLVEAPLESWRRNLSRSVGPKAV